MKGDTGKWIICPVCGGEGTHVNPSIDCNGLGPDDFAEDPDFAESYFGGAYDVGCNTCGGSGKVLASQWAETAEQLSDAADDRVLRAMEDGQSPAGLRDWRFGGAAIPSYAFNADGEQAYDYDTGDDD